MAGAIGSCAGSIRYHRELSAMLRAAPRTFTFFDTAQIVLPKPTNPTPGRVSANRLPVFALREPGQTCSSSVRTLRMTRVVKVTRGQPAPERRWSSFAHAGVGPNGPVSATQ